MTKHSWENLGIVRPNFIYVWPYVLILIVRVPFFCNCPNFIKNILLKWGIIFYYNSATVIRLCIWFPIIRPEVTMIRTSLGVALKVVRSLMWTSARKVKPWNNFLWYLPNTVSSKLESPRSCTCMHVCKHACAHTQFVKRIWPYTVMKVCYNSLCKPIDFASDAGDWSM